MTCTLKRILGLCFVLLTVAAVPLTPEMWKGEHFSKLQGGAFVRLSFSGFKASKSGAFTGSSVQIVLNNLLHGPEYVLTMDQAKLGGGPMDIWKLPSGKFELLSVSMVDNEGTRRTWRKAKTDRRVLIVPRQCLSNFGLWTISPQGAESLAVQFAMVPNPYREEVSKHESSVAAVVDGFTGLVQETLGGTRVLKASQRNFDTKKSGRASITYTYVVSMSYRLNLFKHNYRAKEISEVLDASDGLIRKCYTEALVLQDGLKGDLTFTFILSKETGTMTRLRYTGGSLSDPKMVQCVYLTLGRLQFPVSETMIGEIRYNYDAK